MRNYPKCKSCGIKLKDYRSKRCKSCTRRETSFSLESRKKISKSVKKFIAENPGKIGFQKGHKINLGRRYSLERNTKIRLSKTGRRRPPFTKEWLKNMSEAVHKRHKEINFGFKNGKRNPSWAGGQTAIYGSGFTGFLKRKIKERDEYKCQSCGAFKCLTTHHINYNKKDCSEENLITLCRSCNVKVNFNREYWKNYFKNLWEK